MATLNCSNLITKNMSLHRFRYLAIITPIVILWLTLLFASDQLGVDFYPLYFAANHLHMGLSPYGAAATTQLTREWSAPFATAGVAYPLPLILLISPLALLPFMLAVTIWVCLGGIGAFSALRLRLDQPYLVVVPFLFLPFFRSVVMGQATLIWFALAVSIVFAIQQQKPTLVGILAALLLLKPQNGLIFAASGLFWAWKNHRSGLWWFLGVSLALWGGAQLCQPGWFKEWLGQLQVYQAIVRPPSLLPGSIAVVLACWRLPWWARIAAVQVACFPLSDLYSGLPLLLCLLGIGGPLAVGASSISWLWSIVGLPNTTEVFWWLILAPLIASAIWRSWGAAYFQPLPASKATD